jgi:hypothetical protein
LSLTLSADSAEELPAHPSEPSYPCCISALGELAEVTPHGESKVKFIRPDKMPKPTDRLRRLRALSALEASQENSPSGLWRALGKRVGCKPSGVRIPHSPPATLLIDEANPASDRLFGLATKKRLLVWIKARERLWQPQQRRSATNRTEGRAEPKAIT